MSGYTEILCPLFQYNMLCDRQVKHSVTQVCFVGEYAVQFNEENLYFGNLYREEILQKVSQAI
jgi:hypothetical protein